MSTLNVTTITDGTNTVAVADLGPSSPPTGLAEVGTVAFCDQIGSGSVTTPGATQTGAKLEYADHNGNAVSSSIPGTWRATGKPGNSLAMTWIRIS